jgi:glyoxylase-like metal-dependent hydrolase (beta-lactamase superfamily II)
VNVPLSAIVKAGEGAQDAVSINDHVFMSRGTSNSYLVTTSDGDALINTGMYFEAPQIKARFERVSSSPVRVIIFTQGHSNQVGGWSRFDRPGIETIAQANHADVREYWHRLQPFYTRRTEKLWSRDVSEVDRSYQPPEPVVTTTFLDSHGFTLGGRRFELYATPGGETTDSLVVWLPEERTVFIGNLMGPIFGHLPNLYTVRGDKIRSAWSVISSVDRVIGLEPETLITGHDPVRGAEEIRRRMIRVRDATQYLLDKTFEGMNAGIDLFTLMRRITLPPELDVAQGHGKVPWVVRAIWEEHAGWFRYESTTELYDVPPSGVWPDLTELAGGATALSERARAHLDAGRPLHALHLVDIVLAQAPDDAPALQARVEALEALLERSGRENFSEVRWLEAEIGDAQARLA